MDLSWAPRMSLPIPPPDPPPAPPPAAPQSGRVAMPTANCLLCPGCVCVRGVCTCGRACPRVGEVCTCGWGVCTCGRACTDRQGLESFPIGEAHVPGTLHSVGEASSGLDSQRPVRTGSWLLPCPASALGTQGSVGRGCPGRRSPNPGSALCTHSRPPPPQPFYRS